MNRFVLGIGAALSGLAKALPALAVCLLLPLGAGAGGARAGGCFGTALVFAIDASGSIDDSEYRLQMAGLSRALREPAVADAVRGAGGVALAAVIWSDTAFGASRIGWQSVRGPRDIERFAGRLEALPRAGGGGTDLGQGLWEALDLLEDPALCAGRRVVDVSGDGRETLYPRRRHGASVFSARKRAAEAGIVVNGLAIVDEETDLAQYYREQVVVGAGAFVIPADSFDDFGAAMKAKLLREITPAAQTRLREIPFRTAEAKGPAHGSPRPADQTQAARSSGERPATPPSVAGIAALTSSGMMSSPNRRRIRPARPTITFSFASRVR
jgi:hypothetical protein